MTNYQICSRCIMDTTDPDIRFDDQTVCNHCHRYDEELPKRVVKGEEGQIKLNTLIDEIKAKGKGREYDCIIGVSGGVDSTWVAYLTKKMGLNPLAVHFDNGWNSELANSNIEKTLKVLGIDLYTHVINWPEFRDLQLSFLKASTPDGEVPTDHAINALLFREAARRGIRTIITGMNFATESASVPKWAYGHSDYKYIRAVHTRFGSKKLSNYPHFTFSDLFRWTFINRIRSVSILNYMEYNKEEAMEVLTKELGWVYYGGKHYESVYTRFYQGYILPKKFNIDKRKIHLSDLIRSGQVTREQALRELDAPIYPEELLEQDYEFVLKKLGLSEQQFRELMDLEPRLFTDYPNSYATVNRLKTLVNWLRNAGLYSR